MNIVFPREEPLSVLPGDADDIGDGRSRLTRRERIAFLISQSNNSLKTKSGKPADKSSLSHCIRAEITPSGHQKTRPAKSALLPFTKRI